MNQINFKHLEPSISIIHLIFFFFLFHRHRLIESDRNHHFDYSVTFQSLKLYKLKLNFFFNTDQMYY